VAGGARLDEWESARLLGLLNMALADGYMSSFDTKYTYNFWRPVTAIRHAATDGNSRIYNGFHFRLAVEAGIARGERIGRRAVRRFLIPLR
jgi:hypothetical protein